MLLMRYAVPTRDLVILVAGLLALALLTVVLRAVPDLSATTVALAFLLVRPEGLFGEKLIDRV